MTHNINDGFILFITWSNIVVYALIDGSCNPTLKEKLKHYSIFYDWDKLWSLLNNK